MSCAGATQHLGRTPRSSTPTAHPGWTITFSTRRSTVCSATTVEQRSTGNSKGPVRKVVAFQSAHPDFFIAHLDVAKAAEQPEVLVAFGATLRYASRPRCQEVSPTFARRTRGNRQRSLRWPATCASPAGKARLFGTPVVGVGLIPHGGKAGIPC